MLASAQREYDQQARLTALAVAQALRIAPRGSRAVAQSVQQYQAAAIRLSLGALSGILAEQGIDDAADAAVTPSSLLTGTQALTGMLDSAASGSAATNIVQTMVRDAGRTARTVDAATRPAVTRYIRSLSPPSCGRCAVLAGRVYRFSTGFQRHPRCDCLMTPTTQGVAPDLVTKPEPDQITDLTTADRTAVDAGADLGTVVNVKRRTAGLVVGSSVMYRAGKLTPQGCVAVATSRAQALELLKQHGYIT